MKSLLPLLIALTGCAGIDTAPAQAGNGQASKAAMEARCASWAHLAELPDWVVEKHTKNAERRLTTQTFWNEVGYATGLTAGVAIYRDQSEREISHIYYLESCGDRV
jgi:hypothetical protein